MTKPAYLMWAMLALVIVLAACDSSGNQTPVPNPQAETRVILAAGGGAGRQRLRGRPCRR